jgi:glycosyltransferase involved in cell wall biosynthesis
LPNSFHLYLVGGSREDGTDFQEQQRIQALVNELGLNAVTVFTGRISQTLLPAYYAAGDICVVPSYYEPFGLVAIEAMAAGTPVIASDVGGLQHTVVHGETGLLFPPRDHIALKSAIHSLLENPILRESYGNAAQNWVQSRFSNSGVAAQIYELYQSLTLDTFVQEVIQNNKLTPDLEKQIQTLLKSKALKSNEIKALEKLIDSFSNGIVQWAMS